MNIKQVSLVSYFFIILSIFIQTAAQNTETIDKRTIKAVVGKEFTIKVFENGTTGFLWFWLINDTPTHNPLQLIRKEAVVKKQKQFLVGSGQDVNWVFQATKPGTHHVMMVYKRSWEPSVGQYLDVTVEVAA